jgi:4-aminobutyrate aminotransferase-like enzyme
LQQHAREVGEDLLQGLMRLAGKHRILGDVRGSGFFLGAELVQNRETREPASTEANRVVNRMRAKGVLLGTDGPFHNVLKIRPPMPFSAVDAEHLLATLDETLIEL